MLHVGEPAPDFELQDEHGRGVRLSDYQGKSSVVLMFYPDQYVAADVEVFGINPGSAATHRKFSERHGFKTPLLLDEGGKVSRAYDALMPIPIINIVNRTVVGIDREGMIRFYERGMPSTSTILSTMGAQSVEA